MTTPKRKLTEYKKQKEGRLPPAIAQYISVWESLTGTKMAKDQVWVFLRLDGFKASSKEIISLMGLYCNEFEGLNKKYMDSLGSKTPENFLRAIPLLRQLLPIYWISEAAIAYKASEYIFPTELVYLSDTWKSLLSDKYPTTTELNRWVECLDKFNYWELSLKEKEYAEQSK